MRKVTLFLVIRIYYVFLWEHNTVNCMKKNVLLLLPLFLGACSESGESPVITVEKLYMNEEGEENYAHKMEEMPSLKVGDKIIAGLSLDGNGSELKTFQLEKDGGVDTELLYQHTEVTTEGNLTDEKSGRLRFQDGVTQTHVMVKAVVKEVSKDGFVKLSFYLSSKAECEGAQEKIDLKTASN